ncbi:S8 family peptidase, partial [bacterium]|nr:S8 family peptidase [bacterium]
HDAALVQCEQIQFFRAAGQMSGAIADDTRLPDPGQPSAPGQLGEPVVALFDGLPLQNHRRLAGRLVIDDPDNFENDYQAADRRHGTGMASLIVHGDLDANEPPISRRLYVRPILRPDPRDWRTPRRETVAESDLVVDLIHRAVRRLFEPTGDEAPAAPHVKVINLSIGIPDRPFDNSLSPLARLLDWLAWKFRVLFVVSAGNHGHSIELTIPRTQLAATDAQALQTEVIKAVAADARNRRLLSPAEAVNVLTIGALHDDASACAVPAGYLSPYVDGSLPSPINAQGMG